MKLYSKGQVKILDGSSMWLVYDWQSAVVVNAQGDIVDSMTIQGLPSSREILVRINQIQSNERTEEAEVLHSRFPGILNGELQPLLYAHSIEFD